MHFTLSEWNCMWICCIVHMLTSSCAHTQFWELLKIPKPSIMSPSFPPVYIVENILKIIALGPFKYFTRFWNMWVLSSSEIVSILCPEVLIVTLKTECWIRRKEVGRKRKASSKYEWIWVLNFADLTLSFSPWVWLVCVWNQNTTSWLLCGPSNSLGRHSCKW